MLCTDSRHTAIIQPHCSEAMRNLVNIKELGPRLFWGGILIAVSILLFWMASLTPHFIEPYRPVTIGLGCLCIAVLALFPRLPKIAGTLLVICSYTLLLGPEIYLLCIGKVHEVDWFLICMLLMGSGEWIIKLFQRKKDGRP